MNKPEEFLKCFAEIVLAEPTTLDATTELSSLENWDSMAQVGAVALLDEFGVQLAPGALASCRTVGDLLVHIKS